MPPSIDASQLRVSPLLTRDVIARARALLRFDDVGDKAVMHVRRFRINDKTNNKAGNTRREACAREGVSLSLLVSIARAIIYLRRPVDSV